MHLRIRITIFVLCLAASPLFSKPGDAFQGHHLTHQNTPMSTSRTIVFIHGLFQNPDSWAAWQKYFESLGYTCHAPAYPFHAGNPTELRANPPEGLRNLELQTVVDSMVAYIDRLPEKPILIGHSMGGLIVQILLGKGKGVAAVSIDSAPPKGIITTKWSFLKANFPTISPFKGNSVCLPSVKWFHYAFCNTMTLEETQREYDRYVVPEGRNIPRKSTGKQGHIDFARPHAPLLMIAGGSDNIIPPSLNLKNFKAYKDPNSRREFKEFPGRGHYICGQKGWEEVAGYVGEWLKGL